MSPYPLDPVEARGPMRLVLTSYPSRDAALRAVDAALARRLAACANLVPIDSRYWWKDRVESAGETLVLFKTVPKRVGGLFRFLKETHPYDVPEVVEIGDAYDGAYAISVRYYGTNLEDLRPDQSDATGPMLASLLAALFKVPKSPDLPVGWYWRPRRSDLTWRGWLSEWLVDDPRQPVHDWRAALAAQSEVDRIYRAGEARVRDLIEACPERRDLVHGDLLHANVLVAEDASRPNAVFSWKRSLRGDFLFDTAWCTFCSAIWYPGIAAADPWDRVRREPSVREDAEAWVDASERHHCYELHIGLTALASPAAWVDDPEANGGSGPGTHLRQQIATQLAVVLERGPLPVAP